MRFARGIIVFPLIGLLLISIFAIIVVFGPKIGISNFGQLGQRQEQQESAAVVAPPSTDTDGDGFTNAVETYMGTDPNMNCSPNTTVHAWPPDVNNDKAVSAIDSNKVIAKFGTTAGDSKYDKRLDMNADRAISAIDINIVLGKFGKTCTYYNLSGSASVEKVTFNWSPGIVENWVYIRATDMTTTGRTTCDLETIKADAANIVAAIGTGKTSYISTEGGFVPRVDHKYCAAIEKDGLIRSRYLEFTMGHYNLSASPSIGRVVFNWSPALERGNGTMPVNDMTVSGRTTCDQATLDTYNGSGSAGGIDTTMTSLTWDTIGAGPQAGHTYCAAIRSGSAIASSNFVQFTVPTPSPTPSPLASP